MTEDGAQEPDSPRSFSSYRDRYKLRHIDPRTSKSALRRYLALLVHYCRSKYELALLVLVPTLYFRLFPSIFTHNSITLSAYLSITLVYIPVKVILSAWRACGSPAQMGVGHKRRDSLLPSLPSFVESTPHTSTSWKASGLATGSKTIISSLWICGALFTLWGYTQGFASPFPSASSIISSSPTLQSQQSRNASYFLAASFYNNEEILDSWTKETLKLIDVLGPSNVYVSLNENDSEDNTASKLLHFGSKLRQLNISYSLNITSGLRGYPPDNPWHSIKHRMEYMANLRNRVLEPLERLEMRFENVILFNDILFHHTDVLKLIATLGGDDLEKDTQDHVSSRGRAEIHGQRRRRMACSLDMDGATLYDTWVLRDRCGRPVSGFWPFFASEKDRNSVRKGQVLEVGTCWNGIVVLDGDMLLEPKIRSKHAEWDATPLRFQQPPECIISECALLPLNIMNITGGAPIVMDPTVIVAYNAKWWRFYAVWLRTPLVRLWMRIFEENYWSLWWSMGMGNGLMWKGLDDGKEKGECVTKGWPTCDSAEYVERGAMILRRLEDEL